MDCSVCLEHFDADARRPKVLPCGHSLCLSCVLKVGCYRQCPQCRQEWPLRHGLPPDNYNLLDLIHSAAAVTKSAADQWCLDCLLPSAPCQLDHDVRNARVLLRQCLEDAVPRAQRQLDGLLEGRGLAVMRELHGATTAATITTATVRLSVLEGDRRTFGAEWPACEDELLHCLVAALVVQGRLEEELQEPEAVEAQHAAPQLAAPQLAAPQLAAPQLAAPQLAAPQLAAPQLAAPQLAAPQLAAPQLAAPQLAAPQLAAPQHAAPQLAAPQLAAPQHAAPQLAAPQHAAPLQVNDSSQTDAEEERALDVRLEEHRLRDMVPRAKGQLDGLLDGVNGGVVRAALRQLRGAPATVALSVEQDEEATFGAEWTVGGDGLLDCLLATLVVRGRLLQVIETLYVGVLSQTLPEQDLKEKAALLDSVQQRGVCRMENLRCGMDPAWVLSLLRTAAPTLEQLSVYNASAEQLGVVHAMPRLRRLQLDCRTLDAFKPPVLPAVPRGKLRWLHVVRLPRPTLASMLEAHSATLEVLWLHVGLAGLKPWPTNCHDLGGLLAQCGLRASRVVLVRAYFTHNTMRCRDQLYAVRHALPGTRVQCKECDDCGGDF